MLAYVFVTRFEAPYQGGVDLTGCGGGMTGFAKDPPTVNPLGSSSDFEKWKTESAIVYCEATPYGELSQGPYPQNR